jgi:hypothetical protein
MSDDQLRMRRALLGVNREDVDALQSRLAETVSELADTRIEKKELSVELQSARQALGESAGWSERLPLAVERLGLLAAGELERGEQEDRLAAAVLAVGGEHLLSSVEIEIGDPTGELARGTECNQNGRPIRTLVKLGRCVVDCTWQPGVDAGKDTTGIVEALCVAVVHSLASAVTVPSERVVLTQLGDERSCRRQLALRARLSEPTGVVEVAIDEGCVAPHSELYGREAWSAALARAAAALEAIARAHGGQAYHVSDFRFRLVVDEDRVADAEADAVRELADYDEVIFTVGDA